MYKIGLYFNLTEKVVHTIVDIDEFKLFVAYMMVENSLKYAQNQDWIVKTQKLFLAEQGKL